jgi:membrane associated rhomboid family serine protease
MFFPIGDDNIKGGAPPIFSWLFLAMNVAIFGWMFLQPPEIGEAFVDRYAYYPKDISNFQNLETLLTSAFLHGGWMHLIGNMLFLWVFADNIEAAIGSFRFAFFYIVGAIVAALAHTAFNLGSVVPCVGSSGAIAAVLGAYLVMFPASKVRILVFLIFFFPRFTVPAFIFLGIWIVQQFISGFGSLGLETADSGGGVAWFAHIGGFVFGAIMGLFYRQRFRTRDLEIREIA